MKTDIWMPLYIGDLLKDTTRLKDKGFGIYMLLLIDLWTNEELPIDIDDLSFISRTTDIDLLEKIMYKYFTKTDTGYTQKRVIEEKAKADSRRKTAKANGKKGGRPAKNNNPQKTNGLSLGKPTKNPKGNPQKSSSSSSSSSQLPIQSKTEDKEPPNPLRGKRFKPDLDFIASDEWRAIYSEWVNNKKSKYQKQIGVEKGYSLLLNLSNNSIETARAIIDKSLANNWAGLFAIDLKADTVEADWIEEGRKQQDREIEEWNRKHGVKE